MNNQNATIYTGTAPGRMDVMGGIADYSGAQVLQKTIAEKTSVQLQVSDQPNIQITSTTNTGETFDFSVSIAVLEQNVAVSDYYRQLGQKIKKTAGGFWAVYVIGCMAVFCKEKEKPFKGFKMRISSEVPLGKGVSSSAALEIAVMRALYKAYGLEPLHKTEPALLAQKAENEVVGAPCGLMDQLACSLGHTDYLLPILCQPDKVLGPVQVPTNIHFVAIDSGAKHSVGGNAYGRVRTAAAMGFSLMAELEGYQAGSSAVPYSGYWANVSPSVFEQKYRQLLDIKLTGAEFIKNHKIVADPQANVIKDTVYDVQACSAHPVYEQHRCLLFKNLLELFPADETQAEQTLTLLGELMYQSHASYTACGLGHADTDTLVAMARQAGKGVYGAKVTGGGSGGTVCLLVKGEAGLQKARAIHAAFQKEQGKKLVFFG